MTVADARELARSTGRGRARDALRDGWRHRRLVSYFGRRCNEKRYVRTWLGKAWLVLRPGLTLGWQLFVFSLIAKVGSDSGAPYPLMLLLGFATWHLFAESAYWATRTIELNSRVLRAIRVPGLTIILGGLVPAAIDALVTVCFFAIAVAIYGFVDGTLYIELSTATLMVPLALLMLLALGLGIGLLLAVPGAEARDVRFGLRFVLSAWYFLTPVVYPLSAVPEAVRPVVEFNPVAAPVALMTNGILGAEAPSPASVIWAAAVGVALLVAGLMVFARYERRVLDFV